ncbi:MULTISPECIES: enoyl-CoA hydratase-related protein [Virgibacillus]|uniref:Enoyl-CoA hydratase n=1 Tax=Virgibacillus pantothenticus TaxID=1473 RepID=A0A0L0QTL3_VIRPA|nr:MULTISPECIES: enoyl-CoA hydratase-related protein [Virgibacillus]API91102.1 enoyl-CoA hydratase [Virgibacillus sp. 6R]KNE21944.1 enoyl-CoA hydratase [Virgibacillus pantothenticus]MBS7429090.1 enoyl-CoA hydratase/isomerase family protein [Virgibacillus sp. 19R1-5]MED3735284.1 enoyl-CoA hydratase-related protein [Virgibacillus pantothenticus]QTY17187.1 enoyl-CoA hydratase/isomerase family protein [Virgibacillus pantothenticus]
MGSLVISESKDGISYIHLNRPERYNALNLEMLEELNRTLEEVEKNEDKVVILSGEGNAFCSGGDISMMDRLTVYDEFAAVMDTIGKITLKLYLMPKIVISAIQGSAVGLGLSYALTADFVVAQQEAKFGMLFIGIGLVPDGGGHFLIKERIGTQQAKQFIWSLQQIDAIRAKKMGLIDELTSDRVIPYTIQLANKLNQAPILSMLETKMLYHTRQKESLMDYLEAEKEAQWKLRNTLDHKEGVHAFLEKRKPAFQGK